MLSLVEANALGHFCYFPKQLGFNVSQLGRLTLINCQLGSSMFNIVWGGLKDEATKMRAEINAVISKFNQQPFAWWVPPSEVSESQRDLMQQMGFVVEAAEHAMVCNVMDELESNSLPDGFQIVATEDAVSLDQFTHVIASYDNTARSFYKRLKASDLVGQERCYVGIDNGKPVAIGSIFVNRDSAGIFNVITSEDCQGRGVGTAIMRHLLEQAKALGAKHVTLSASSDSGFRIYERLGFKVHGAFDCFEWPGV